MRRRGRVIGPLRRNTRSIIIIQTTKTAGKPKSTRWVHKTAPFYIPVFEPSELSYFLLFLWEGPCDNCVICIIRRLKCMFRSQPHIVGFHLWRSVGERQTTPWAITICLMHFCPRQNIRRRKEHVGRPYGIHYGSLFRCVKPTSPAFHYHASALHRSVLMSDFLCSLTLWFCFV